MTTGGTKDLSALLAEAFENMQARIAADPVEAERLRQDAENDERRAKKDQETSFLSMCPVRAALGVFHGKAEKTVVCQAAIDWVDSKRNLLLRGGVGTGKTTACAMAALQVWKRHKPLSWLTPDELVSAVLHSYSSDAPKLHGFVVVDDIGRETKAGFEESLCALLDRPFTRVLMTTNLTKVAFRDRYKDERLIDRLRETSDAIDVPGKSRRGQSEFF